MDIFKLHIDDISLSEVNHRITQHKGFNFIVTPNLQHVVDLNKKKIFLNAIKRLI